MTRRRRRYQRLPPATCSASSNKRPAWRGIRLGRKRPALGSTARRIGGWTQRCGSWVGRWSPPRHLRLTRVVDTCINSMLLRPLKKFVRGFPSAVQVASQLGEGASSLSQPPKLQRHGDSSTRRRRGKEFGGGRAGVMLNICVADVLLRRSSSQVRSSPLQEARNENIIHRRARFGPDSGRERHVFRSTNQLLVVLRHRHEPSSPFVLATNRRQACPVNNPHPHAWNNLFSCLWNN
jgi:hypothetical protein